MTKNTNINKNIALIIHHCDRDMVTSWVMRVVYSESLERTLNNLKRPEIL